METKLAHLRKDTHYSSHMYSSLCQCSGASSITSLRLLRAHSLRGSLLPSCSGLSSWHLLSCASSRVQQISFLWALGQMFSGLRGWVLGKECGDFEGLTELALEGQHASNSA